MPKASATKSPAAPKQPVSAISAGEVQDRCSMTGSNPIFKSCEDLRTALSSCTPQPKDKGTTPIDEREDHCIILTNECIDLVQKKSGDTEYAAFRAELDLAFKKYQPKKTPSIYPCLYFAHDLPKKQRSPAPIEQGATIDKPKDGAFLCSFRDAKFVPRDGEHRESKTLKYLRDGFINGIKVDIEYKLRDLPGDIKDMTYTITIDGKSTGKKVMRYKTSDQMNFEVTPPSEKDGKGWSVRMVKLNTK